MRLLRLTGILMLSIWLSACSSSDKKDEIPTNLSEIQLYRKAQTELDKQNFRSAIDHLRALESRYPFGPFAEQAQLELIYAYYQNVEPEASRAAAERFIRLHPRHPNVDYAYYMNGLTSNTADLGLLERYIPVDMSRRDPGRARESFNDFSELLTRFPNSQYAPDARKRMIYLRNQLAAYEIHVARYYIKRKAWVAAANRGKYVVEQMQETPAVADGLAVMVEAYQHLGLLDAADSALAVLKLNYPHHNTLDMDGNFIGFGTSGDVDPSLLYTVSFGLFGTDGSTPPPPRAIEDAPETAEPEQERSWLNILTFGWLGDDAANED